MSEISVLPVWKKDANAYERLSELALYAKQHPERFEKFVICHQEVLPNGRWKFRTFEYKANLIEALGMYQIAQKQQYEDSCK